MEWCAHSHSFHAITLQSSNLMMGTDPYLMERGTAFPAKTTRLRSPQQSLNPLYRDQFWPLDSSSPFPPKTSVFWLSMALPIFQTQPMKLELFAPLSYHKPAIKDSIPMFAGFLWVQSHQASHEIYEIPSVCCLKFPESTWSTWIPCFTADHIRLLRLGAFEVLAPHRRIDPPSTSLASSLLEGLSSMVLSWGYS